MASETPHDVAVGWYGGGGVVEVAVGRSAAYITGIARVCAKTELYVVELPWTCV